MARLKRFELLTHCLEGSCSIQLSYRRTGRGSKIRTYDHSLPKRVRYQTAPYPEKLTHLNSKLLCVKNFDNDSIRLLLHLDR